MPFDGIGVDEEPIVGFPIRRQARQRHRAVQPDSQLRRSTLLDVLPGRQVARPHTPQAANSSHVVGLAML
jgi:hypothetical protein